MPRVVIGRIAIAVITALRAVLVYGEGPALCNRPVEPRQIRAFRFFRARTVGVPHRRVGLR
jgi:hypothetical protein